jgi:hypothetical protein
MLIRDKKFDESYQTNIKNIKNKHDVCIGTSFCQCLETNQRASVHVWRKIEHVRPPQTTQCIPYELLLRVLNSIDVCAIERPPYTTGVLKFRAHKGNKIIYLRQVQFNLHLIKFILKNCFQKDTRGRIL